MKRKKHFEISSCNCISDHLQRNGENRDPKRTSSMKHEIKLKEKNHYKHMAVRRVAKGIGNKIPVENFVFFLLLSFSKSKKCIYILLLLQRIFFTLARSFEFC